jgi:hypothetical protein
MRLEEEWGIDSNQSREQVQISDVFIQAIKGCKDWHTELNVFSAGNKRKPYWFQVSLSTVPWICRINLLFIPNFHVTHNAPPLKVIPVLPYKGLVKYLVDVTEEGKLLFNRTPAAETFCSASLMGTGLEMMNTWYKTHV